jgi:ketosteroid isomerase-like protein
MCRFISYLTVAPILCVACDAPSSAPRPLSESDIAAIRAVDEAFVDALLAEDWPAYTALLTEDVVQLPPTFPIQRGHDAIIEFLKTGGVDFVECSMSNVEIKGTGDMAYRVADYTMSISLPTAEEPLFYHGKWLTVFRRSPGGSWRIAADMWNTNPPPRGGGSG